MLAVVAILSLLGAIIYPAMQWATEEAKRAKTRATIDKINSVIMAKWESYRTRRVPCNVTMLANTLYANDPDTPFYKACARVRLNALHELMRLEMPDRMSDVYKDIQNMQVGDTSVLLQTNAGTYLTQLPALTIRYQSLFAAARQAVGSGKAGDAAIASQADAKCLYMIVMSDPDAAAQFHEDEISRIDASGLPVFIDGWGNPIHFLRWPAGFVPDLGADSDLQTRAIIPGTTFFVSPDPFDPMKIALSNGGATGNTGGYALYPLIYSAGPDGREETTSDGVKYTDGTDINVGKSNGGSSVYSYSLLNGIDLDPYAPDGTNKFLVGQPVDANGLDISNGGSLRHHDNIHNHRSER